MPQENATQRTRCKRCLYPGVTCVCESISAVNCHTSIDILQHPSETKNAKNTARLAKLCIPHSKIWIGEGPKDFGDLRQQLSSEERPIAVIFPAPEAIDINEFSAAFNAEQYARLVFLDGTWKKAYKMWQLNSWLHNYRTLKISDEKGQYHIRKAPREGCLSTIESICYCIESLEPGADCSPLGNSFHKMQDYFLHYRGSICDKNETL